MNIDNIYDLTIDKLQPLNKVLVLLWLDDLEIPETEMTLDVIMRQQISDVLESICDGGYYDDIQDWAGSIILNGYEGKNTQLLCTLLEDFFDSHEDNPHIIPIMMNEYRDKEECYNMKYVEEDAFDKYETITGMHICIDGEWWFAHYDGQVTIEKRGMQ